MGYIRHHAIVVTSNEEGIKKSHTKAKEIFPNVSNIMKDGINGYQSFFIPPDGSKEGWPSSHKGDQRRKEYVQWINEQAYDDGSNQISFAHFYYGDDEEQCEIEDHN